ncbi:right-handed parallel beta-helix repeat-containing protein [Asaia bogorensis]|uniref:right-handed parallel beta-helix repeat-containing protein n=1 Tax=Asaia bogorensis TaxID=91915 RepID=UPI00301929F1
MDYTSAQGYALVNGVRQFVDRNLAAGVGGTYLSAQDKNAVQNEILTVIQKAGLAPSASDLTQLWQAILQLASSGQFLQEGNGAVERSMQSKLREVADVTDFGVVHDPAGDYIAANTAAYHNALQACSGLRRLRHRAGLTTILNPLTIGMPTQLELDGLIQLAPNANAGVVTLGASNIAIEGKGTIDGNLSRQQGGIGTALGGIVANSSQTNSATLIRPSNPVLISNIRVRGITIQNVFNWPVSIGFASNCILDDINMLNSGSSPQFIFSSNNCWLLHSRITGITDGGFVFYQGSSNCGARGNSVWGNHDGLGVFCDDSSMDPDYYVSLTDNLVYGNRDSGIGITTGGANPSRNQRRILVATNILWGNNNGGGQGLGSIGLVGAQGVMVRQNLIYGDGAENTAGNAAYSIYANEACSEITVDDNLIGNVGSAAAPGTAIYINNPVNTRVTNNSVYDTGGASGTTAAGIGGGFGAGGILGGNVAMGPIAGHLMQVNLLPDTLVVGQQRADGKQMFSGGLAITSGDVEIDNGYLGLTSYPNAAAAGTSQSDANPIAQQSITVTYAAAQSGLILPGSAGVGVWFSIQNRSGADIMIYPPVGGQIEGLAMNAGYLLSNTNSVRLVREASSFTGGEWRAVQSGQIISAGNLAINQGFLTQPNYAAAAASGTGQADANPLNQAYVVCTSAAANAGLRLPDWSGTGAAVSVFNRSGNTILIYPPVNGQIEGQGQNAGLSLATGSQATFVRFSSEYAGGQWFAKG